MRAPGANLDVVFQDTGIWLWLVHAAMSLVFAGLLGIMWWRLQRPLVGWLAAFFATHLVAACAIATYWSGGLESPIASVLLAVVTAGAVVAVVPIAMGAARASTGAAPLERRILTLWGCGAASYGVVAALLILARTDRSDLVVTAAFRPLALLAAVAPVLIFRDVAARDGVARTMRILRTGFLAACGLAVAEALFRTQVSMSAAPAFAMTSTVIANLMGLLVLGITALLATVTLSRAELQAALEREVQLSRQEAQAARLESLGRLAEAIACDFNALFDDAAAHLTASRAQWRDDPDRAVAEMRGVREAVERGTHITASLLRLARPADMTTRSLTPVTRLQELLPVLSRMTSRGRSWQVDLPAQGALQMAPSQFDQLVLNVVLLVLDTAPAGSPVRVSMHDVPARSNDAPPAGIVNDSGWLRFAVACDAEAEAPAHRAARDDVVVLSDAVAQLAREAAGGYVRVTPRSSGAAIEVWLPALTTPGDGASRPIDATLAADVAAIAGT